MLWKYPEDVSWADMDFIVMNECLLPFFNSNNVIMKRDGSGPS